MNATQYLTEALGEEPDFTPRETSAISHLMDGYAKEVAKSAALSGTSEFSGSAPDPRDEVVSWAQACLTALNVGGIAKDSKLHHKLREVIIEYRRKINS